MRKQKYMMTAVLLLGLALAGACFTRCFGNTEGQKDEEGLFVVTSFYPMYIATLNVVGDCEGVFLQNLSEPQTGCLHDYQLTPQDMILLSKADVFVINGGGMEDFLVEVAEAYPDLQIVDAGAAFWGNGEASASAHDDGEEEAFASVHDDGEEEAFASMHGDGEEEAFASAHDHGENAHVWMSIPHYMEQVSAIAKGLSQADPAHRGEYEANATSYREKIQKLWQEAAPLRDRAQGEQAILFHEAFAFLAEDYGMEVAGTLDLDEERQVSASETAQILKTIEEKKVKILLAEDLYGRDMGDTIEKETDCRACYLNPLVRGEKDPGSWLTGMEENILLLQKLLLGGEEQEP